MTKHRSIPAISNKEKENRTCVEIRNRFLSSTDFPFGWSRTIGGKGPYQGFTDLIPSVVRGRPHIDPSNDPGPNCGSPAPIVLKIFNNELIWS